MEYLHYIGPGLAVGLSGLGVAVGQGILAKKAMKVMARNSAMITFYLTVTILGVALVESAVIYGLVVAFQLLASETLGLFSSLGAGLAIGLAGLGAGWGEGILIAGALDAMERNPNIKGKILTFMVLFVALVEVTAIYGLIIAFQILGAQSDSLVHLGAGLAIGLAGIGVAIGRGYLSEEALGIMGRNPNSLNFFLTIAILGIALVESAAIYALVIAFQILGTDGLNGIAAISAGLAIGLAGLGVGIGIGLLVKGAMSAMNKAPDIRNKIMTFMILFIALIEVVAIYGLIIAFRSLGAVAEKSEELSIIFNTLI